MSKFFDFFARSKPSQKGNRILCDTALVGDINTNGVIYIDGEVHGHITGLQEDSVVYVERNGRVYGDVTAPIVFIEGCVHGVVESSMSVTVTGSGKILGCLYHLGEFIAESSGKEHEITKAIKGRRPAYEVRASAKHLLRDERLPIPLPAQSAKSDY
jgi:hypothetical protein